MAQRLSTAPCDDYQPFEAGEHNTSQTFIYFVCWRVGMYV